MYKKSYEFVSTAKMPYQRAESNASFMLTGKLHEKHDNVPFDMDSDIPEFHCSVKSSRFTLCSGSMLTAQDFDGQIAEYMARTASTVVCYMAMNGYAYFMNMVEFEMFLRRFCSLQRESGGKFMKVRMRSAESDTHIKWLESHIA